jgi:predicted polyphosphate/ATP-dependent NAD kinase
LTSAGKEVRLRQAGVRYAKRTIGLIVNPIAGIGGRVGLKGSDGSDTLQRAIALGAVPTSAKRAVEALARISRVRNSFVLVTYPADMGEDEAKAAGFDPVVEGSIVRKKTTSDDTRRAAREMLDLKVELILFAGGDGTARDLCEVVGLKVPVIGIPAGVKIHSAVFAVNPSGAGDLAVRFLQREPTELREMEVMDIDEEVFRDNRVSAKLFGYMKVPFHRALIQSAKASSPTSESSSVIEIATEIVEHMQQDWLYILGPGTTTKAITDKLGLQKTLLGVDVIFNRNSFASDVNESKLLEVLSEKQAKIIVTVIGGQGFIFGRGNQQISPQVIRRVGKENIIIVATPTKLVSLKGAHLLVDTGDSELDAELSGYTRVVTGYGRSVIYRVSNRSES